MKNINALVIVIMLLMGCQEDKDSTNISSKDISVNVDVGMLEQIGGLVNDNAYTSSLSALITLDFKNKKGAHIRLVGDDILSVVVNKEEAVAVEKYCAENNVKSYFCGYKIFFDSSQIGYSPYFTREELSGKLDLEISIVRSGGERLVATTTLPSPIRLSSPSFPYPKIIANKQTVLISWESEQPVTEIHLHGVGAPCNASDSYENIAELVVFPSVTDTYYQTPLPTFGGKNENCDFHTFTLNLISNQSSLSVAKEIFSKVNLHWKSEIVLPLSSKY